MFTFNSSNRYMIDACVTERGRQARRVATLGSEDAMFVSTIRRYALDQETAVSACVLDDSLLYESRASAARCRRDGRSLFAPQRRRFARRILAGLRLSLSARQHASGGTADFGALGARNRSGSAGKARHRRRGGQSLSPRSTRSATCWTFPRRASTSPCFTATSWSSTPPTSLNMPRFADAVRARRADARRRPAVLLGSQHGLAL